RRQPANDRSMGVLICAVSWRNHFPCRLRALAVRWHRVQIVFDSELQKTVEKRSDHTLYEGILRSWREKRSRVTFRVLGNEARRRDLVTRLRCRRGSALAAHH